MALLLDALGDGMYELATTAQLLTDWLLADGRDALDPAQRSAFEQARSNAHAIVASLDRVP